MNVREVTYLPTGAALSDEVIQTGTLDQTTLNAYEGWWRGQNSRASTSVATSLGSIQAQLTFSAGGQGLGTFFLEAAPIYSSVLLAGYDADADADLLEMFLSSVREIEHVRSLSNEELPFELLRTFRDRPLAAGVFWPIVPVTEFSRVSPFLSYINCSFFSVFGRVG